MHLRDLPTPCSPSCHGDRDEAGSAAYRGFRAGRHPPDGLSRRYCPDARGSRTVASPESTREAAEVLRLAGSPGRAGSWTRARKCCGAVCKPIPRALAAGKIVPRIGGADEPCGIHARNPNAKRARGSAWKDADAAR